MFIMFDILFFNKFYLFFSLSGYLYFVDQFFLYIHSIKIN